MNTKELIDVIVECAKLVRKQLSYGFEEKVYKNARFKPTQALPKGGMFNR